MDDSILYNFDFKSIARRTSLTYDELEEHDLCPDCNVSFMTYVIEHQIRFLRCPTCYYYER
jgi:hypothetical protein